jgi:hypothetical protein
LKTKEQAGWVEAKRDPALAKNSLTFFALHIFAAL